MDETTQPTEAAPPTSPPVAADCDTGSAAVRGSDDNLVLLDDRTPPATTGRPADVDSGKVAVAEAVSVPENVTYVDFSTKRDDPVSGGKQTDKPIVATRGKKSSATRGNKEVATRGKGRQKASAGWRVDAVKASKNTWAFRLRWYEDGQRGTPDYVTRVSDSVYKLIRKNNYEAFKQNLIASHSTSAVSASNGS